MSPTQLLKYGIFLVLIFSLSTVSLAQSSDDKPVIRYTVGENIGIDSIINDRVASRLEEMGYEVELLPLSTTELKIEAVAIGQADFVETTSHPAWLAVSSDIPLVMVLEVMSADWVIAGSADIESCDDWDGKTIAHHSETSLTAAVATYYAETFCPNANLEVAYIRGSANRVAALMSGAIDLTIASIETISPLVEEAPDDIHIVADLVQELPWLVGSSINVSAEFVENHPDAVQDLVTSFIAVIHEINADPEIIIDEVALIMELEPEDALSVIQIYTDNGILSTNGGLTEERITQSIEFLELAEFLPEGLTVDTVADLSFIENALIELGIETDSE